MGRGDQGPALMTGRRRRSARTALPLSDEQIDQIERAIAGRKQPDALKILRRQLACNPEHPNTAELARFLLRSITDANLSWKSAPPVLALIERGQGGDVDPELLEDLPEWLSLHEHLDHAEFDSFGRINELGRLLVPAWIRQLKQLNRDDPADREIFESAEMHAHRNGIAMFTISSRMPEARAMVTNAIRYNSDELPELADELALGAFERIIEKRPGTGADAPRGGPGRARDLALLIRAEESRTHSLVQEVDAERNAVVHVRKERDGNETLCGLSCGKNADGWAAGHRGDWRDFYPNNCPDCQRLIEEGKAPEAAAKELAESSPFEALPRREELDAEVLAELRSELCRNPGVYGEREVKRIDGRIWKKWRRGAAEQLTERLQETTADDRELWKNLLVNRAHPAFNHDVVPSPTPKELQKLLFDALNRSGSDRAEKLGQAADQLLSEKLADQLEMGSS